MKKIVLTIAAVFAIGISANAQQQVKFGPKAGVNFSNLTGNDDSEMLTGFHVGAVAEIKFNDKFSVQPELTYSLQGSGISGSSTILGVTTSYEGKQKLDYINIPVMAKYYVAEGFSIEAGPQVGFLMKAEAESDTSVGNVTKNSKTDNKDSFKGTDFGVNFGLAYDFSNGFFINGRYNLGLTDIRENTDNGDAVKNNVIQVGVGFKF